jgi:hypothetical protein
MVQLFDKSKETFLIKKSSVPDKNPILTNAITLNHPTVILMIRPQELLALLKNQKQQMSQHQQQQKCLGQPQHPKENQQ